MTPCTTTPESTQGLNTLLSTPIPPNTISGSFAQLYRPQEKALLFMPYIGDCGDHFNLVSYSLRELDTTQHTAEAFVTKNLNPKALFTQGAKVHIPRCFLCFVE